MLVAARKTREPLDELEVSLFVYVIPFNLTVICILPLRKNFITDSSAVNARFTYGKALIFYCFCFNIANREHVLTDTLRKLNLTIIMEEIMTWVGKLKSVMYIIE